MRKVKLFVSSPSDLDRERRRIQDVVVQLNGEFTGTVQFELYLWEDDSFSAGQTYQDQIPPTADSDIVVSIFWSRLGRVLAPAVRLRRDGTPFPDDLTGSTFELLSALDAAAHRGRPHVLVFQKTAEPLRPLGDEEAFRKATADWRAVNDFIAGLFAADAQGLKPYQTFETTDEFERELALALRRWIAKNVLAERRLWPAHRGTPFPGLAAYDMDHADVYFGRARKVAAAVAALRANADRGLPLLFITGPSGAGKSSLMRAGLAPRLTTRGIVDGVDFWRIAAFRPGGAASPFLALAESLAGRAAGAEGAAPAGALPELAGTGFGDPNKLASLLAGASEASPVPILAVLDGIAAAKREEFGYGRPVGANLLLLVDQFEDIFAVGGDETEREGQEALRRLFFELLGILAGTQRIWVAATLRADMIDRVSRPPFIALFDRSARYLLATPGEAELEEIIEKSAEAVGVEYGTDPETGSRLDEVLRSEARTEDSLPLLSFALNRLYAAREQEDGRWVLTGRAYRAFGGVAGAIDAAASEALAKEFGASPAAYEGQLARLLRALVVQVVDSRSDTVGREALSVRPVPLVELPEDRVTARLVKALVGARIMLTDSRAAGAAASSPGASEAAPGRQATLRIAHERVLESWALGREIVAREKRFFQVRTNVADQHRLWLESGRSADELIRAPVSLAAARDLRASYGAELKELEPFIEQSERQARRRRHLVRGVIAGLAVLALAAGGFAVQSWRNAVEAQENYGVARDQVAQLIDQVAGRLDRTFGIRADTVDAVLKVTEDALGKLAKDNDDPALRRIRATMLYRFAKIYQKSAPVRRKAGSGEPPPAPMELAQRFAAESLALRRALDGGDPAAQASLAESYELVGDIAREKRTPDLKAAREAQEAALKLREGLAEAAPDDVARQAAVSRSQVRIGDLDMRRPDLDAASERYGKSLAIAKSLVTRHPGDDLAWREYSWSLNKAGDLTLTRDRRSPDAAPLYRLSACIRNDLLSRHAGDTLIMEDIAFSLGKLADAPGVADAQVAAFESLRITQDLARGDPSNGNYALSRGRTLLQIGALKLANKEVAGALSFFSESYRVLDLLAQAYPDDNRIRRERVSAMARRYSILGDSRGNIFREDDFDGFARDVEESERLFRARSELRTCAPLSVAAVSALP